MPDKNPPSLEELKELFDDLSESAAERFNNHDRKLKDYKKELERHEKTQTAILIITLGTTIAFLIAFIFLVIDYFSYHHCN